MIKLSSILLFTFVIPFIMTVSLAPFSTPHWLFGLIFLFLLTYLALDLTRIKNIYFLKQVVLWGTILLVLGSSFRAIIIERHVTHPIYKIHDMPLQQELAIRFLLDGKNPYSESYEGTFLEQWNYSDKEKNPALYHFVLPPLYVLFAVPFYFLSNATLGYFDARIPLLFLFFSVLVMGHFLIKNKENRLLFSTLFAFNPAMLGYTLEGRSDVFMFSFLFASLFLLYKERLFLAGVPMGLAFAVKQSVWPIFPLYVLYLFLKTKSFKTTVRNTLSLLLVFSALVLPFLIWDYKSFLDSTVFYLSGNLENSYPISGYGFGKFLNQIGVIKDTHQYFPFHVIQLLLGLPALFVLYKFLKKKLTVSRLIVAYGIFLFVFWYFSRYFNNSHLAYLSMVFITAYFWPDNESTSS
jgi:hypothetical protein